MFLQPGQNTQSTYLGKGPNIIFLKYIGVGVIEGQNKSNWYINKKNLNSNQNIKNLLPYSALPLEQN